MPQTRIARHVHLETDCHCPTIEVPTEAELLMDQVVRLSEDKLRLEDRLDAAQEVIAAGRLAVGGNMGGHVALKNALARYDALRR